MDDKPLESWGKRFVHKVLQRVKPGSKRTPAPSFNRSSSTPPNTSESSSQQLEISTLQESTSSLLIPVDPTTHFSNEPSAAAADLATGGALPIASVTPAPTLIHGPTEVSSAAQTTKFVVKGALAILSDAAAGIPIPGIKGIFDIILKVIGVIEATQANQEGFKALEIRCQALMDTVISPLKGKELSEIPSVLQASVTDLKSNLTKVWADVLEKLKLGKLAHAMNHEEDMATIKTMNDQITHFLEFYSANINTSTTMMVHQVHQTQVMAISVRNMAGETCSMPPDASFPRKFFRCFEEKNL